MNDDAALLRRYVEEGSEAAFTELVRRHVDLVYGAALRRTGDAHRAADVAQQVFTALARNARKLSRHAVLGAWLHTATRNAALNLMISEQRRKVRESEALALEAASATTGGASPDWDRLRPLLDTAIDELPEADRAAVVLRFLERRAFAEIGAALQVSEDAARMRTERALDKLRSTLARRGITSTAAALGAIVASQAVGATPSGLAATLASQSLATAGTGSLATILASFMTTKLITTAAVTALIAFFIGANVGPNRHIESPPPLENPRQTQMITSLRQGNQRLQAEVAGLNANITRLNEANAALAAQRAAPPPSAPAVAPRGPTLGLARWEVQQAVLNNLRQIAAARDRFLLERGHPPASVEELVGRDRYIKTLRTVGGEDYSAVSMTAGGLLTVTTPDGITVIYDESGPTTTRPEVPAEVARVQELGRRMRGAMNQAVKAYRAAHEGIDPPSEQALIPYFATPKEGADFTEFLEAKKGAGL